MKFGIIIPRNVKEGLKHDRINKNNYWAEEIAQEFLKYVFIERKRR